MTAQEVAEALDELAGRLEFKGENRFKVQAYRRGANAVRALGDELPARVKAHTLDEVSGIGEKLAKVIGEIYTRGTIGSLEELRKAVPAGVVEMGQIRGIGPRKAMQLHDTLGINNLEDLKHALDDGRLLKARGFGPSTVAFLRRNIQAQEAAAHACRLDEADEMAWTLVSALDAAGAIDVVVTGATRRRVETVSRIELVAAHPEVKDFAARLMKGHVLLRAARLDDHTLSFEAPRGVPGLLHLCHPFDLAAATVATTGTPEHLAALNRHAEPLVFSSQGARLDGDPVHFPDEESVFEALDLQFIPPELRETGDEILLAARHAIPHLVDITDLKGALHNHTVHSDGNATTEQMQRAAREFGLSYFGISDHSRTASYAGGQSVEELLDQRHELDALEGKGCALLHGSEVDILEHGELDYPASVLRKLDFVVASVHSRFRQDEVTMTQRLVTAIKNPFTDVLGHPTGRLILSRPPYHFDLAQILEAAVESGIAIELNCSPDRLDFSSEMMKEARAAGIPICINADAHSTREIDFLRTGIAQARRAWLTPDHVLNTRSLPELRAWLKARRSRRHHRAA